jgi:hypothetical protein
LAGKTEHAAALEKAKLAPKMAKSTTSDEESMQI